MSIEENIWKWNVNVLLWNRISWMLFVLFMFMDSLFHTNRVHGADMKSMPSIPPRRLRSKFGRVEGCYMLHRLGMLTVGHFFGHKNIARRGQEIRKHARLQRLQGPRLFFGKHGGRPPSSAGVKLVRCPWRLSSAESPPPTSTGGNKLWHMWHHGTSAHKKNSRWKKHI